MDGRASIEARVSLNLAPILTFRLSDCIVVFVSTDASVHRAKCVCGQMMTCQSVLMCIGAMSTRQIVWTTRNHKFPEAFICTFLYLLPAKKWRIYCTSREGVMVTRTVSWMCKHHLTFVLISASLSTLAMWFFKILKKYKLLLCSKNLGCCIR